MPQVIVLTDDGREVWRAPGIMAHDVTDLACPTNVTGSGIAAGVRRALQDAEAIQRGQDPERPSEKAVRMAWGQIVANEEASARLDDPDGLAAERGQRPHHDNEGNEIHDA